MAICEQVEEASQAQGIVRREVTQVIGPGLPYDVDKSDRRDHHYIACVAEGKGEGAAQFFLTFLDYTTGDFWATVVADEQEVIERLSLYSPKELLCYLGQWDHLCSLKKFIQSDRFLVTYLSLDDFDEQINHGSLKKLIRDYQQDQILALYPQVLPALAALSFYICSTQRQQSYHHIRPFRMESEEGKLKVSSTTLKGIEILPKSKDLYHESLLGFFDRTKSAIGSRELKRVFQNPLAEPEELRSRQDCVEGFLHSQELLEEVRDQLASVRDIERVLVKLTRGRIQGGDLLHLSQAILVYHQLKQRLDNPAFEIIHRWMSGDQIASLVRLARDIDDTISSEPGAQLEKGNLINRGGSSGAGSFIFSRGGCPRGDEKFGEKISGKLWHSYA